MRVFLLGAGASKAYDQSPTGLRMPIACDFFETYDKTSLSTDPWALIGGLVAYLESRLRDVSAFDYLRSGIDIEALHSEIEVARNQALERAQSGDWMIPFRAYNELVFLFASVINEIQNGPVSQPHINLVGALQPNDVIITFNWDTLLDRALYETTQWRPDWGYGRSPHHIFRDGWVLPENKPREIVAPSLIKLHGSTNWLTAHPVTDGSGAIVSNQRASADAFAVYEHSRGPFACFAGRYRGGFLPFSYGYYPPNLNMPERDAPEGHNMVWIRPEVPWRPRGRSSEEGLPSIPLIIPPVKNKRYDFFGNLFSSLWDRAGDAISQASEIVIIGYSFPRTDIQSDRLFRTAFSRRNTMPKVSILDPAPDRVAAKFADDLGIDREHLFVEKGYFASDYDLARLVS